MLIGRDHPAGVLRGEINRTAGSHGGLVLVTGEAGIGKTALATGAAEEARALGALVLTGACWDSDSAPGYWPWVQVIRGLRGAMPEDATGNVLSVLLGEAPGTELDGGFELYDAVTTALVSAARRRPVVVVLDDLHWADAESVRLLEFAARHTWFERLLLVGTYRDVEVEPAEHPLRPLLVPLAAKATTVTLTGLGPAEVGTLMARTVGQEPDEDLAAEVHRRTGGNPFFVEQTARLWRSGGSVTAVAPGVRDALQRRLSLLPQQVADLLTGAAVLGQEFHRQVLAATAAAPVPQVDRLLDQACALRLVAALGGGRFAFAHDLVRETLYQALDEAAARKRHAAVVRALDDVPTVRDRVLPADLARHAHLAGVELEPASAVKHLLAAGCDARRRLADEEAIGHFRRAYERADPRDRVLVALELAYALYSRDERDEVRSLLAEAVATARTLDEPDLLARVALTGHRLELGDEPLAEAHRELVGGPAPESPADLAGVLAAALTMRARRGGDDEALSFGLWTQHDSIWGPGTAAERVALTDELVKLAHRTADHEMEQFATSFAWVALVELDDPRYLDRLSTFVAMVERSGQPRMRMGALMDQSIIAALTGRFAEAQEFYEGLVNFPEEHDHAFFHHMIGHIRWSFLLLQGRFDELDEVHRELAKYGHPFSQVLQAIVAVERGDVGAALRQVDGGGRYPRYLLSLWLRLQAQLGAATRDPERCERARAELLPYAGQWLVALYGCDVSGPVDHWLGVLDAAQERWTEAIEWFTRARRSADLMQARPWSVEARLGLAEALLARGDRTAATELLAEVSRDAAALGMRHIPDRVRRVRSTVDNPAPVNEFRFDGDVWTLTMAGRTVHVPDAKGLHDLHALLGKPGADVPAVRLLDPAGGEVVVAARRLGGDQILDDEARSAYRRRLSVLDEEIDRCTLRGDDNRAAALDREREALLAELRAAAGLGGRTRRLGDEAERARKAVTARIRDTLRKLDDRHPELATHLRATISTGATCTYQPDPSTRWRL